MVFFNNKNEMIKATDDEIREFFSNTVFEGVFSKEIKSNYPEYFKGHIHSIKINGVENNVIGTFVNVPNYANDIPEGPCTFKCRLKDEVRISPSQIAFSLSPKTLRSPNSIISASSFIKKKHDIEPLEQELYDAWGVDNAQIIGYYHHDDEKDRNVIDDIRKPNFVHIPYYPNDPYKRPVKVTFPFELKVEKDDYYLFTWRLFHKNEKNPYQIAIDFKTPPRQIEPKWFIDTLFDDRHNDKSKNFDSTTNFLDTLSKQLSAKDSTFVYELLQNANDYPVEGKMVDVEFHVTDNYLLFMHSGATFNVRNISGICGINEKEKVANKKAIGYKGIGFKTVFLNNHYVYLRTGKYSFRFEEKADKIKRLNAPWPILPVWTEHYEVAKEVNEVFDASSDKFGVQIALRPDKKSILHQGRNSYENLFKDVFNDSNIILFIPNINSVKVIIDGEKVRECKRNNDAWVINDYCEDIDDCKYIKEDFKHLVNRTIDTGSSRIPEKYKDFDVTKVSFACRRKGSELQKVEDATLYCYLPTSASWGFNFLMNTDMIPEGDRDDIESEVTLLDEDETNFNEELAAIAGAKFFEWIKELIESKKYDLKSIFSLIPDFKKCIKEHKEYKLYIERFQESFEAMLKKEALIPDEDGKLHLVLDTIYDETSLMTTGIMDDNDFYTIMGYSTNVILPSKEIRGDKNFCRFQKHYLEEFDAESKIWTKDDFVDICSDDDFQNWVGVEVNNHQFLNFLLEKEWLEDFCNEAIFMNQTGDLHSASDTFYDVDDYIEDISAFTDLFSYLSPATRTYFAENAKWEEGAVSLFASFDADNFVDDLLLSDDNIVDTKERLKTKDTSIHFYKFLAENVGFSQNYLELPFFDNDDNVIDDFYDKFIFCPSENGAAIFDSSWLDNVEVAFLSKDYFQVTLDYFKVNDTFGVSDYCDEIVVKDIILSDDYHDIINEAQQKDYDTSKSFVDFCYKNKEYINEGALSNYALGTYDKEGEYDYVLSEDNIYFPSALYDDLSSKEWLSNGWMYCLDEDYFEGDNEEKKFIKDAFGVDNLTDKRFYREVVRPNLDDIIENISGSNDGDGEKNIDFVAYLDKNYALIFEEEKDEEKFNELVFLGHADDGGVYDISVNASYVYLYDDELLDIIQQEWFPDNLVDICTEKYGESKAVKTIRAKKYEFKTFFDDVITEEVSTINDAITSLEHSVAFHQLVINNKSELTPTQLEVMQKAKVYLYNKDAEDSSAGHKILSEAANELAELKLVDFSDLDIIDPAYPIKGNTDYWKDRLGNTSFSVNDFASWIEENEDAFAETIGDVKLNIAFWCWAKENLLKQTKKLVNLPILLSDESSAIIDDVIYLSNDYIVEGGIESIVKKYDNDAHFVSNSYIDDEDDIESWKSFWVSVGLHSEIIDILTNTIIRKLDEIEDETLPATLAHHRTKLEELYGEDFLNKLSKLKVKCQDGTFYSLSDTIYLDCEASEPFPFITLSNQIVFSAASVVAERRLVKELVIEQDGTVIKDVSTWTHEKINKYLDIQDNNDEDSLREIHFQFINELAKMLLENKLSLDDYKDSLENVYILDETDEFCTSSDLTLSSVYHPFCDFQSYSIDGFKYTSDAYHKCCEEKMRTLFYKIFKIHCDFKKEDANCLKNREFAIYFWTNFLAEKSKNHHLGDVINIIEDDVLNDIPCIPTEDDTKRPGDMYSKKIADYVKAAECENMLPLDTIPDYEDNTGGTLFDHMPFMESLSFEDSIAALPKCKSQEKRSQVLSWMLKNYDSSCDDLIEEYRKREDAIWMNTKKKESLITELYALSPNSKRLNSYFGGSEKIIHKDYFPSSDFKEICDMLQIKVIEEDELKISPEEPIYPNSTAKQEMLAVALTIAGIEKSSDWAESYEGYKNIIEELDIKACKSILIAYKEDESLKLPLKKFYYDEENNAFLYVKNLKSPQAFEGYLNAFIDILGLDYDSKDLISDMLCETECVLQYIAEREDLLDDERFMDELDNLISGARKRLFPEPQPERQPEPQPSPRPQPDSSPTPHSEPVPKSTPDPQPSPSKKHDLPQMTSEENALLYHIFGEAFMTLEDRIINHYLAMLRIHNCLIQEGRIEPLSEEELQRKLTSDEPNFETEQYHYVYGASAMGGIWYLSPHIWNKLKEGTYEVYVYTGDEEQDIVKIRTIEELKEHMREDAVIIKASSNHRFELLEALFSDAMKDKYGDTHTLVKIGSAGERYKSVFKNQSNTGYSSGSISEI